MPWFEGSIRDAVATAKSRRAIFVVFVEGSDEASRCTSEALRSAEIGAKLQSEDFIVIKIESNGESFRQFSQIYHLVPVPSLFFIGNNGVPLEVIAGEVRSIELLRRIDDVLTRSGKSTPQQSSASLISGESESVENSPTALPTAPLVLPSSSSSQVVQVVTTVTPATPEAEEEAVPAEEGASGSAQPARVPEESSLEDSLERARELIKLKNQQRKEEEEREARNRELERRRVGQEVQRARRQQVEQEALQAAEQIRKDRLAEQEARQRVLQQIAQDKAERAARQNQANLEAKEAREAEEAKRAVEEARRRDAQAAARAADGARVQFRLPDGSAHTHIFTSDTPLSEVRAYASANLQLPFRDFGMSMTFPRREFTAEDNTRTVMELQLCPTAVILILPAHRGEIVSQPGYGSALVTWIWALVTPLISLYAYVRGLLFARAPPPPASRPTTRAAPADAGAGHTTGTGGSGSSSLRHRAQAPDEGASIRRQGNIHRLANRQDSSDDENNTWNGNSTQQM